MTQRDASSVAGEIVAARSQRVFDVFGVWLERYFQRKFTAVRLLRGSRPEADPAKPLVVYANHPSWWDPLVFILLSARVAPQRKCFGPMDARMLEKYRFMKRLGVFGVEQDSRRGAAQFLLAARGLLADPANTLWLTPQGHFSDARARPVKFQPGLGHIARDSEATFVPLAMELTFWNEPAPELLLAFGEPVVAQPRTASAEDWTARFESSLSATLDRLAEASMTRDADRFETLVAGRSGVAPVYDTFRYLKALATGSKYRPAHGDR
jgi:1-acyl-sn-glycerol-3-phosphate acyltransferase